MTSNKTIFENCTKNISKIVFYRENILDQSSHNEDNTEEKNNNNGIDRMIQERSDIEKDKGV